jgi:hypothetical protein
MMSEIFSSRNGQRVLSECKAALALPVNSDEESRELVLKRFAMELDIYPHELEDLLEWKATETLTETLTDEDENREKQ